MSHASVGQKYAANSIKNTSMVNIIWYSSVLGVTDKCENFYFCHSKADLSGKKGQCLDRDEQAFLRYQDIGKVACPVFLSR